MPHESAVLNLKYIENAAQAATRGRYAAFEKRLKRENKENRTNADSTGENRIREIALKNREVEGVKKN
jgi:hypothetical protein